MFIECKEYTLAEIKKALSITKWQWEERKSDLLAYLHLFFDYEITMKGRGYCFIIKEQYQDYEPLPRKTKAAEISAFYGAETDKIIEHKPRNTSSNLAREITETNNKYEHAVGTATNYICPYVKQNYTVGEREWCKINYNTHSYDKISDDQLVFLKEQFKKYLNSEKIADIIADQEAGYISQEQAYNNLKAHYNDAMDAFKNKYGFRPYKAGELIKKAWVIEE